MGKWRIIDGNLGRRLAMKPYLLLILLVFHLTSCYRMPEEGEVSTVPNTNNPTNTRQKNPSLMPGIEY